MAVDPSSLSDVNKLRALLQNAKRANRDDLVLACQFRIAEILGQPFDPGIEREFWQAIFVAEEFATQDNGKTTRLSRTRQKIGRVGVLQTVADLAAEKKISPGFKFLLKGGRLDMTAKAIVLRHKEKFPRDVVDASKQKLADAGLQPDAASLRLGV